MNNNKRNSDSSSSRSSTDSLYKLRRVESKVGLRTLDNPSTITISSDDSVCEDKSIINYLRNKQSTKLCHNYDSSIFINSLNAFKEYLINNENNGYSKNVSNNKFLKEKLNKFEISHERCAETMDDEDLFRSKFEKIKINIGDLTSESETTIDENLVKCECKCSNNIDVNDSIICDCCIPDEQSINIELEIPETIVPQKPMKPKPKIFTISSSKICNCKKVDEIIEEDIDDVDELAENSKTSLIDDYCNIYGNCVETPKLKTTIINEDNNDEVLSSPRSSEVDEITISRSTSQLSELLDGRNRKRDFNKSKKEKTIIIPVPTINEIVKANLCEIMQMKLLNRS